MNKFNVGCGPWDFGAGWINVDAIQLPHIDSHDIYLSEYKRESADLIYSSHLIEYFDRTEVIDLLRAWRRVLKVGEQLWLSVPNWDKLKNLPLNQILGPLYGKMRMGNEWIYHKTVYDGDSLKDLLLYCGFRDTTAWDPEYRMPDSNDCSHAEISLNMRAVK